MYEEETSGRSKGQTVGSLSSRWWVDSINNQYIPYPHTVVVSLPAGIPVQKAWHPRPRELRIPFDPPFNPRLGFLLADGPCPTKTFPLFPSWDACPTLAGDVDVYLNLLPAPQSTSSAPLGVSRIEVVNLEGLKDVFSGAERQLTYQGGDTSMGEGYLLVSPCSIL